MNLAYIVIPVSRKDADCGIRRGGRRVTHRPTRGPRAPKPRSPTPSSWQNDYLPKIPILIQPLMSGLACRSIFIIIYPLLGVPCQPKPDDRE